jgi:hypothetical protein
MRSRHLLSVSLLAVAALLYMPAATAQMGPHSGSGISFHSGTSFHGVPPSVTSFGFGGSPGFHGVPPSVTSPNFGRIPFQPHPGFGFPHAGFGFGHHHHNHGFVNPAFGGAYYVPYAYPAYVMDPGAYDSMETDYAAPPNSDQSGPDQIRHELDALRSTVEDYRDELRSERQRDQPQAKPEVEQPAANQPKTVLVFRDGHQMEIVNYAIVGGTLYDLSEGRTKKVELAELDLPATVKQNDDRGVNFQLPAGLKRN